MRITIEHYIATNNPAAVDGMLSKRGIPRAKNLPDAISKLRTILKREGDIAAKELASIQTPYQQMISSTQETTSNACGCKEDKSNCCGFDSEIELPNEITKNGNSAKMASEPTPVPTPTPAPTPTPTEASETARDDKMTKAMPYVAVGLLLVVATAILIKK